MLLLVHAIFIPLQSFSKDLCYWAPHNGVMQMYS